MKPAYLQAHESNDRLDSFATPDLPDEIEYQFNGAYTLHKVIENAIGEKTTDRTSYPKPQTSV